MKKELPKTASNPSDAQKLMTMASEAKALAEQLQRDSESGKKIPIHRLRPDVRDMINQLTQRHASCMLLLNKAVQKPVHEDTREQVRNPRPGKTMAETPGMGLHMEAPVKAMQTTLKGMTPKELADKMVLNLKGAAAKKAMASIVYQCDQALKNDPKLRTAMGLWPDQTKVAVDSFVKGLKLSSGDKAELKRNLMAAIEKRLPAPGNVEKLEKIGEGGVGAVFKGKFDGQDVVVKTPKAGDLIVLHEVLTHDAIMHNPNLPKLHGVFRGEDGKITMVMDQIKGLDCGDMFKPDPLAPPAEGTVPQKFQALTPEEKMKAGVHVLAGLVSGLAAMHASGVGHYDIKANNMMFSTETMQGMLIDLGVSGVPGENYYLGTEVEEGIPAEVEILPGGNYAFRGRNTDTAFLPLSEDVGALGKMLSEDFIPNGLTHTQNTAMAEAVRLLRQTPPENRPTMEQLSQVFKGEEVSLVTGGDGLKSSDELQALRDAFGPQGMFYGGQNVLAGIL